MNTPVIAEMVLLCESMTIRPDGRPVYRHVLSELVVPELPATVDVMCYAAEIWGLPEGDIEIALSIFGPGEERISETPPQPLPPAPDGIRAFGGTLERLHVSQAGVHEFRLSHGGEVLGLARFVVVVDPERVRRSFP